MEKETVVSPKNRKEILFFPVFLSDSVQPKLLACIEK
jgi:hypothetical protein